MKHICKWLECNKNATDLRDSPVVIDELEDEVISPDVVDQRAEDEIPADYEDQPGHQPVALWNLAR